MLGVQVEHGELAVRHLRRPLGEGARRRADLLDLDVCGEDVPQGALELVAPDDEPLAAELDVLEPLERADSVVAPGHRLDESVAHRLAVVAHRRRQSRRQRARAVDDRLDVSLTVGTRWVLDQRRDVLLHLRVDPLGRRLDDGLIEVAQANLAGEVRDVLIPAVQRDDQPVECLAEIVADVSDQLIRFLETPVEDREDRTARRVGTVLGEEQPVGRLLECALPLEAVDAVVGERPAQLVQKRLGQTLGLGIERAQPGVQVFLRTGEQLRIDVLIAGARARQDAQVGEHPQQTVLAGNERGIAGKQIRAQPVEVGDRAVNLGRTDVIAANEPFHPQEVLPALIGDHRLGRGGELGERQPHAGRRCILLDGLEREQWRLRTNVDVRADEYLLDATVERGEQRGFHLHRLDDRHDVALVDDVALADRDRYDDCRREVTHDAAVVP